MKPTYSIRNWHTLFENNRTRELKKLDWVPIPNKQDGDGYTLIMERKNGAAIFGTWIALVQIASRCDNPAGGCGNPAGRGVLVRDGGKPHDSTSLSRMTRIPQTLIEETLGLLSSPDINWLECKTLQSEPENPAGGCGNPAGGCLEGKGREGKEEKGILMSGKPDVCVPLAALKKEAEGIYALYPRKVGKPKALTAIQKQIQKFSVETVKAATERFASAWRGGDMQFCPHPATWYGQERFNDAPETWTHSTHQAANGKPAAKTPFDRQLDDALRKLHSNE